MMELKDFYTKTGVTAKFILKDIDGKDSGHWFTVGGTESTEWRNSRYKRMTESISKHNEGEIIPPVMLNKDRESAELLSCVVHGWSFTTEFNRRDVEEFLFNTPYILDQLDSFVYNKSMFFKKK